MEEPQESHVIDIVNAVTLVKGVADRFSREHPEHAKDVETFLQELDRITSKLRSAVYARQKAQGGCMLETQPAPPWEWRKRTR